MLDTTKSDAIVSRTRISAAGLRILKLLVGNPPRSMMELIRVAGVTRTAVSEQLNELVAAGLVERELERLPGRGRPRHRYSATPAALHLLFASGQQRVVPAIWRAIEDVGGTDLTHKVVRRVSRALAEHYTTRITPRAPKERLERFIELLREEGGLLDVVEKKNGHLTVFKRSCPFIAMVDSNRTVCALDLELMSAVVGKTLKRTACRHDGDPCCVIEIAGR